MECFDNIISFRDKCDNTPPTSGLYTDTLGLHRAEIEKYIQPPYPTAELFFNDMVKAAVQDMAAKINAKFMPQYKSTSIVEGGRIGQTFDNMQTYPAELNKMRGVEVEICNDGSPFVFYLSELSLFVDMSTTVNVLVYDMLQNKLIDTIEVETVANQITTVNPHRKYKANRKKLNLAFIYDVSVLDQYYTLLQSDSCGSCQTAKTYTRMNGWVNSRGIQFNDSDPKILSNATSLSHTAGLSLVYSVGCDHEQWICQNVNGLALAINHKTCSSILDYALKNSNRQNTKTLFDRPVLEQRIKDHEFNYLQIMDNVLTYMKPPNDIVCFECNRVVKNIVSLP